MAATKYTYAISTDFSAGKVNNTTLAAEIAASSITTALDRIDTAGDVCDIWFADALTAGEETALDNDASPPTAGSVIGDHSGATVKVNFIAATKMVEGEVAITDDATWQVLGATITNLSFFMGDVSKAVGRITGEFTASGTQAQLRVVEDDGTETVLNTTPYSIPSAAYSLQKFSTDVAPIATSDAKFRLEGRLNGATSASVKFVSMSLLEVLIT